MNILFLLNETTKHIDRAIMFSIIVLQNSPPPSLHLGPHAPVQPDQSPLLSIYFVYHFCSPQFCKVHQPLDTSEMPISSGCFPWSLISARINLPFLCTWKEQRRSFFSFSLMTFGFLSQCIIASLSHLLDYRLLWLRAVFQSSFQSLLI